MGVNLPGSHYFRVTRTNDFPRETYESSFQGINPACLAFWTAWVRRLADNFENNLAA